MGWAKASFGGRGANLHSVRSAAAASKARHSTACGASETTAFAIETSWDPGMWQGIPPSDFPSQRGGPLAAGSEYAANGTTPSSPKSRIWPLASSAPTAIPLRAGWMLPPAALPPAPAPRSRRNHREPGFAHYLGAPHGRATHPNSRIVRGNPASNLRANRPRSATLGAALLVGDALLRARGRAGLIKSPVLYQLS